MYALTNFLTSTLATYSLPAIFVAMTLESVFIPIPSEVTMAYAGYLASIGRIDLWAAVVIGALGNLFGSLIAYSIGYVMGDRWVTGVISKWGKYLFIKQSHYLKTKKWFTRNGQAVSFYSRMLPVVRTYISLPVGIARANIWIFGLLTLAGSAIWSGVLAWVGYSLGTNWRAIEPIFHRLESGLVLALVLAGLVYWRKRTKTN